MVCKFRFFCILSLLLSGSAAWCENGGDQLRIVSVTPLGEEVPTTRGEIIIEFNKKMVAFGHTDKDLRDVPVEIKPSLFCDWRWTTTSQLTCTHRDYLRDTTTYVVSIGTSFESLDGSKLENPIEYTFRTLSLGVHGRYDFWRSPTQPIFTVTFTQPMSLGTVLKKVQIQNIHTNKNHQIRAVAEPRRRNWLTNDSRYFILNEDGSWSQASATDTEEIQASLEGEGINLNRYAMGNREFASKVWNVEASSPLVVNSSYDIEVEKGARSIFASDPTSESMHIARFEVYPNFDFIGLECINTQGMFEKQLIDGSKTDRNQLRGCDPDEGITLLFTAPPVSREFRSGLPITPKPTNSDRSLYVEARHSASGFQFHERKDLVFVPRYDFSWRKRLFAQDDNYSKIHLGYRLHGNTTYRISVGSNPIRDAFGRKLSTLSEIEFRTGRLKPKLHGPSVALIDERANAELPIAVANLRDLHLSLFNPLARGSDWSVKEQRQNLDVATDQLVPTTLDLSKLLVEQKTPFVAVLEPRAIRRFGNDPEASCIVGQVTSYNVWARMGHLSSIVWITDLKTGKVVPDVPVSLVRSSGSENTTISKVSTDGQGIAILPGRNELPIVDDGDSPQFFNEEFKDAKCLEFFKSDYGLWFEENEGFSILPLNWYTYIHDWRFGTPQDLHLSVWGHTAQGIYRSGQNVQFKIYVREQTDEGLRTVKSLRYHLIVSVQGEGLVYHESGIELNDVGAFHGEFKIPKSTVGNLNFVVLVDNGEDLETIWNTESGFLRFGHEAWKAFEVEVLDFDPATIRVTNTLNKAAYNRGDELEIESRSEFISGGPFDNAPVSIEASLREERFFSQHPQSKKFTFPSSKGWRPSWEFDDFQTDSDRTDKKGEFRASLHLDLNTVLYGTLTVSLGVQEDGGEVIWDFERVKYRGANRIVGVYHDGTKANIGEPVTVEAIVVGPEGEPKNDLPITMRYFRVSAEGNYGREARNLVHSCELAVGDESSSCTMIPKQSGLYHAVATIRSPSDMTQEAVQRIYVTGQSYRHDDQFEYVRLSNRSEIESREYKGGEIASLMIEHTFPGSVALVTVERLGIFEHWVIDLTGSLDVIDIPIHQDYAPIVRVTATVVTANSLEKPNALVTAADREEFPNSWTLSTKLQVTNSIQPLVVEIDTDKEVYKPGDLVQVRVAISSVSLTDNPTPTELSVAVVDQGVLEMSRAGMKHYDPVRGLLIDRDMDVRAYWMLSNEWNMSYMRGPTDGERNERNPRSNEDLTSLWLPDIEVGSDGTAMFEFEVGDRLTEWKIIVIAATPSELFGLAEKSIRTNLGIEIRPVLPNLVTDGDVFDSSFSILNRTDSTRKVSVEIRATGDVEPYSHTELIALEPFERKVISALTKTELKKGEATFVGSIRLLATASSDEFVDSLEQFVPVHPSKRYFVSSIYGTSTEEAVSENVEFPHDIKDGTGSLSVLVTPTLINAVEERIAQVRDYPYQCWEQRLSSAVVAAQYSRLKERMNVNWKGANNYIRDVLYSAVDFQASSGGFGYWSSQPENTDPYLSAYTALAFSWLSDAGHEIPPTVLSNLLDYLENQGLFLLPDHLRWDKTIGSSLVLTVANALVQHKRGNWKLVSRLYEEGSDANLFATAQTLEAAVQLDASKEKLAPMATRLNNAIGVEGDRALIHHDSAGSRNYSLSSTLKTTCSAVSALVRASRAGKQLVSEEKLAALVRGILFEWNRQGSRANPHESAFCLSAVIEYVENFETYTDDIAIEIQMAMDESVGQVHFERFSNSLEDDRSTMFSTNLGPNYVGKPAELFLRKVGNSRIYYKATLKYESTAIQTKRENLGIDVRKSYWVKNGNGWEELADSRTVQMGDVVHVGLYLDIRDQRDFVIVDDPVPGFLKPINLRLAKTNVREVRPSLDIFGKLIPGDIKADWNILGSSRWGFYNRQIRNENVRFASDFLPSGRYRLYWSGRVISTGDFIARPAHAEAMYSPEIYGNSRLRRVTAIAK